MKSPEPPMPFIILVPVTCVEFTLPKISASRAVFIVISPRRRTTSGLLVISPGRSMILSWKNPIFWNTSFNLSSLTVREQLLANLHFPSFIKSITASCTTSVYISKAGMSGFEPKQAKTALAMFPTPDCKGRNWGGIKPDFNCCARKLQTLFPIFMVTSSTGANGFTPSRLSLSTIPMIFFGSTLTTGTPIQSLGS